MDDLISKQAALKEIERLMGVYFDRKVVLSKVWDAVDALPSAQETHEERTETHACDYIDRQAVRNALLDLTPYKSWRELRYRCEESIADAEGRLGGIGECMGAIDDLPPAQPYVPDTNVANTDTISRQDAIDALWHSIEDEGGELQSYAEAVISDAEDAIKGLPSAQPIEDIHQEKEQAYYRGYEDGAKVARAEEDCGTCKHGRFGDAQCNYCRVRYLSHYERDETRGNNHDKS